MQKLVVIALFALIACTSNTHKEQRSGEVYLKDISATEFVAVNAETGETEVVQDSNALRINFNSITEYRTKRLGTVDPKTRKAPVFVQKEEFQRVQK